LISVTDRLGNQTYFLCDGLGSTANLTDGAGNTTATYSYDLFGAIRSESGTGAAGNEWRFTGEQRDPQSGRNFYYLRARYYDPGIGRFLSQDPLPAGNLYAYAGNNPVNFVDPSGLCHQGPLVILKGEKGQNYYAPIFTSKEEEVGFETFGDCLSAHECELVLDRYCSSGCDVFCGVLHEVEDFLTSDCARGLIAVGGLMAVTFVAAYGAAPFIEMAILVSQSQGAVAGLTVLGLAASSGVADNPADAADLFVTIGEETVNVAECVP